MDFLWFLIVGAIAGWLANIIMKGGSAGLLRNLILGVIGAMIGGPLLGMIGISTWGLAGSIISATVGAIVVIWIVRLISGGK